MFVARKNNSEYFILASEARKTDHFYCPICNEPVILKQGAQVRAHFAHHPDSLCVKNTERSGKGGESPRHDEMKATMLNILIKSNIHSKNYNIEYRIGDLRSDAYTELYFRNQKYPIAVECIYHGNTKLDDVVDKTQYYFKRGIRTLWVADFSEGILDNTGHPILASAVLQELNSWYYSRVYGLSKENELYAAHLEAGKGSYKTVFPYKINNFKIDIPNEKNYHNKHGFQIVKFKERTFWK